MTRRELIDSIRQLEALPTDAALARALGVKPSLLSDWIGDAHRTSAITLLQLERVTSHLITDTPRCAPFTP